MSELNVDQRRSLERWYKLNPHPVQHALIEDQVRFKVIPAGRRSGKTEKAKRFGVKQAMKVPGNYFYAAPTTDQVKRIYWEDLKLLSFSALFPRKPNESELIIWFPNGSTIRLVGLDKPQRIEGVYWHGGFVDEIADTKETAWPLHIKPALDTFNPTTPDYRPWCWLLGVPEGLNHYYDLSEYARLSGDPEWRLYHWKSAEILPQEIIDAARRSLSFKQFKQEYEASFETASGRVYEDYGEKNQTSELIQPHEQLMWHHDFNFTPMSSAIGVRRNGNDFYILDEIILESATSRMSALEFIDRYKEHKNKHLLLYGDPAGRAGEKHGHMSDYTEMEELLRANGWRVERRVKAAAPAIRDRQNSVRAKILNANNEASLFINPHKCEYVHKGLSTVQIKDGSTFLEVDTKYQHITTAIGYCVDYEWPIRAKEVPINLASLRLPTVQHFNEKRTNSYGKR